MPVRINNRELGNDIGPTQPGGRVQPLAAPQRGTRVGGSEPQAQARTAPPRAIPMGPGPSNGGGARAQPARAAARAAPQRINNYQAASKPKGPARAG